MSRQRGVNRRDARLLDQAGQSVEFTPWVGDRVTMGGAVAALATQRYFKFARAIPCHYGSFPIIDQTADKFVAAMEGSKTQVFVAGTNDQFTV